MEYVENIELQIGHESFLPVDNFGSSVYMFHKPKKPVTDLREAWKKILHAFASIHEKGKLEAYALAHEVCGI